MATGHLMSCEATSLLSRAAVVVLASDLETKKLVALKFFTVRSQWIRDKTARSKYKLDERLIVGSTFDQEIDPNDSSLARLRAQLPEDVHLGRHIIVMPAADRSLLDIFQAERPGLGQTRAIMREVIEGIAHMHAQGLVHGDIKVRARR